MRDYKVLSFIAVLAVVGAANAQEAQKPEEQREGGPRWQYQSEQNETKQYVQPGYAPSIPLEVEQHRNRIAALEDRTDKLERALKEAIDVINAQTKSLQILSGK